MKLGVYYRVFKGTPKYVLFQTTEHYKTLKKVRDVIVNWDEVETLGIWLRRSMDDVTRLRSEGRSIKEVASEILFSFYKSVPGDGRWSMLREALEELGKRTLVKDLGLELLGQ